MVFCFEVPDFIKDIVIIKHEAHLLWWICKQDELLLLDNSEQTLWGIFIFQNNNIHHFKDNVKKLPANEVIMEDILNWIETI